MTRTVRKGTFKIVIHSVLKFIAYALATFIIVITCLYMACEQQLRLYAEETEQETVSTVPDNVETEYYASLLKLTSFSTKGSMTYAHLKDANGNVWIWSLPDGKEDMETGDYYSAVMNKNGTNVITDDEIVSLHYERVDLVQEQ